MRLFLALTPSPEILSRIVAFQARLIEELGKEGITWVKPANLHLTLLFLGEVPEKRMSALDQALDQTIGRNLEFQLRYFGLGKFGSLREPRVLWMGIQAPPALLNLALAIAQAGQQFMPEKPPPFKAHLTLARFRKPIGPSASEILNSLIETEADTEFGAQYINRVSLVQSTLSSAGPLYKTLKNYQLRRKLC